MKQNINVVNDVVANFSGRNLTPGEYDFSKCQYVTLEKVDLSKIKILGVPKKCITIINCYGLSDDFNMANVDIDMVRQNISTLRKFCGANKVLKLYDCTDIMGCCDLRKLDHFYVENTNVDNNAKVLLRRGMPYSGKFDSNKILRIAINKCKSCIDLIKINNIKSK